MPSSKEQIELKEAVKSLVDGDPKIRASAAKTLLSASLREFTIQRKEILASDEAWQALLDALSDSDPKVVESASGALAHVIARYRRDRTAFEPLRALLVNKNKQIRIFVVRGIGYVDHPERWNALLPLLNDKVELVCKEVVLAIGHHGKEMPAADRLHAKEAMERMAPGAGPELKMITENAIRVLSSDLPVPPRSGAPD